MVAFVKCQECGNQYSGTERRCPNCGCPAPAPAPSSAPTPPPPPSPASVPPPPPINERRSSPPLRKKKKRKGTARFIFVLLCGIVIWWWKSENQSVREMLSVIWQGITEETTPYTPQQETTPSVPRQQYETSSRQNTGSATRSTNLSVLPDWLAGSWTGTIQTAGGGLEYWTIKIGRDGRIVERIVTDYGEDVSEGYCKYEAGELLINYSGYDGVVVVYDVDRTNQRIGVGGNCWLKKSNGGRNNVQNFQYASEKDRNLMTLANNEKKLKEMVDGLAAIEQCTQVTSTDLYDVAFFKQQIIYLMDEGSRISQRMNDVELADEYRRRKAKFIESFSLMRY